MAFKIVVRSYGRSKRAFKMSLRTLLRQTDLDLSECLYVVLHKESSNPLRMALWRRYFVISPWFEDGDLVVYPTAPTAGRDFDLLDGLAPGVGPISVTTPPDCAHPGGVLKLDVGWGTTAAPGRELDARLSLVSDDTTVRQEQSFRPIYEWSTREWGANVVGRATYTMPVPPSFPTGVYTVTLALVEADTHSEPETSMAVGQVEVTEAACTLPVPSGAVDVNATFGSSLRLLGYRLDREEDQLTLTLHWRSEQLMETDYVIFVHAVDLTTGLRAAQDDAMPLRWTYPTTFWRAGQVVSDDIPLSLKGAPHGAYSLVVGVYDPTTKDRLPVLDAFGRPQPDDQLVLPGDAAIIKWRHL